jgi:hypothetical protein
MATALQRKKVLVARRASGIARANFGVDDIAQRSAHHISKERRCLIPATPCRTIL